VRRTSGVSLSNRVGIQPARAHTCEYVARCRALGHCAQLSFRCSAAEANQYVLILIESLMSLCGSTVSRVETRCRRSVGRHYTSRRYAHYVVDQRFARWHGQSVLLRHPPGTCKRCAAMSRRIRAPIFAPARIWRPYQGNREVRISRASTQPRCAPYGRLRSISRRRMRSASESAPVFSIR
jgi:hypothetical protein